MPGPVLSALPTLTLNLHFTEEEPEACRSEASHAGPTLELSPAQSAWALNAHHQNSPEVSMMSLHLQPLPHSVLPTCCSLSF